MSLQIHNTMHEYIDDAEDTLSLSNFLMEDDAIDSEQLSKPNHSSGSTSSSSSLSEQDFLGFFSEEWSKNASYINSSENIVFCGKVVSSKRPIAGDRKLETKGQTHPLFRSNSDSFRFIRLKTASRRIASRSKSMPNRSASFPCKSRLMVFMFGSGSSKFPTKVDMSDIKSRQLRQQNTSTVSGWVDGGKEESDGGTSGKKGWWRLVDALGCSGGYERDTVGAI
ncbi:hypothetical protein L1987_35045 [Smallanthus sonchifolius]|uniref:Uncharacterized protein n=1 Tax=Smallanthus sonchifolius TaxID=185202 RepID=A0ACB9HVI6_9ASTR|nr:hypothetical protein L1987_35045 [Smallanthus sonchifolius]